jgi:hypothetical protein
VSVHTIGIGRGERVQVQVSPVLRQRTAYLLHADLELFFLPLCGTEDNVRLVCVETTLDPVSQIR